MMLCSNLPYPVMTPQIQDIAKDAPVTFKDNCTIKEFVSKQWIMGIFIEEHAGMEWMLLCNNVAFI